MKRIFSIITVLFCIQLIAENPCGLMRARENFSEWGQGGTYLPNNSILKVYNSNLDEIGVLKRKDSHAYLMINSQDEKEITASNNVEYIGHYDCFIIRTIESEIGGYLEVLINKKGT